MLPKAIIQPWPMRLCPQNERYTAQDDKVFLVGAQIKQGKETRNCVFETRNGLVSAWVIDIAATWLGHRLKGRSSEDDIKRQGPQKHVNLRCRLFAPAGHAYAEGVDFYCPGLSLESGHFSVVCNLLIFEAHVLLLRIDCFRRSIDLKLFLW